MIHASDMFGGLRGHDEVVVTGGAGFVGRHLVTALSRLDKKVTVVDHAELPEDVAALPGVRHARADLRDYGETLLALQGADAVFHLAGNASGTVSVEKPRHDFHLNALGTCNVGNACLELGVRRLVYLSSAIVYGTPQCAPMGEDHPTQPFLPYGASKLSGELTLRSLHQSAGLPVVIGRSFVIYGPGEDPTRAGGEVSQFLRWHLNEQPIPVVGDIDRKTRDFIHVDDLCRALVTLADRGQDGETYNLGSGTEVSMRELAEAVGKATGRPALLDADDSSLEDSFALVADVSRLAALGFSPAIDLAEGLASLAAALGPFPELPTAKAVFRKDRPERRRLTEAAAC
ncbi:NAD-dependent epimerase/dehydratase family protein [Streptomyces sp. AN091965]|uniref:NAD-dependent epimerase/dehydratase family protein n=1 Tax=Streptomyces sp. AN091965 TaxID=2927803 RepID=UPI001F601396|nr:NAD-dependent epimerase/dehydratase family protein [Streptomyces sp. AN091965]MCI3928162.1 NAD-dependent epimerase/dehydratase family protein [Streptomyces sp. AN091965]